ncbi:MAG TPA: peptide-methionine (S)-S-oxide reductase MsrA [Desulfuromonadales bacterium]|nr:peptide-methionine (S)-S-oxide reductase MsrA [Desulfuromonadales bacterium]
MKTLILSFRVILALCCVVVMARNASSATAAPVGALEKAALAGGCFWCMEAPFDQLPGVVSVLPGYIGGKKKNPTYKEVSAGGTGHAEAVQIVYDPAKISYEKLLAVYWHNIDPTVSNRQFCDTGDQYRSAIFYNSEEQRRVALQSRAALEKNKPFKEAVVTEITPAGEFYPAEEYHQHYYKKNPLRYKYYRNGCGRDQRLKELWGSAAGH